MKSARLISVVLLGVGGSIFPAAAAPPDVVFRSDGSSAAGKVTTADAKSLRLEVQVAANQPAAVLTVPLAAIERIDFGETEALEEYIRKADASKQTEIERFWSARKSLLGIPESMAGAFGILLGNLLLEMKTPADHERALAIFQEVESGDWDGKRKARAKEGRLRALVRLGRAEQAIEEANAMAEGQNAPEVMIEARFVLAEARAQQLRKLEEDNPRWQIDDRVQPERDRLYQEALDLYLYPFLFHGAREVESARGLWGATEIYRFAGEREKSIETARDVAILYPSTEFVTRATALLNASPDPKDSHEKNAAP